MRNWRCSGAVGRRPSPSTSFSTSRPSTGSKRCWTRPKRQSPLSSGSWSSFGGLRALAAAIVLLILGAAAGFGIARTIAPTEVAELPGWRSVVADYVALYTPETFALAPADPAAYAPRLKVVGDGLGLDLAPETVALPGLDLKGAILFHYDGKPLGQVSYLSTEYGPVAFCIIKNGREDAPLAFEERRGMNVVFWNSAGRGYLIIGTLPRDRLEALADTLASRVS